MFAGNLKDSLQQALQDSMSTEADAAGHSNKTVESAILIGEPLSLPIVAGNIGLPESVTIIGRCSDYGRHNGAHY